MNAPAEPSQFIPETGFSVALPIISPALFADLVGVPEGVVRGWISRGYIPTYSVGKYTLINLALLNRMALQKAPSL